MPPTGTPQTPQAERPPRRLWLWLLAILVVLGALGALGAVSLAGRSFDLPGWATGRVEAAVNRQAEVAGVSVTLGQISIALDEAGIPRIVLRNVGLSDQAGTRIADLNDVTARVAMRAVLRGRIEPEQLRLNGAQIVIRRALDGTLSLTFGGTGGATGDPAAVLDAIDARFAQAPLASIARIEAADVTITFEDARSGRLWQATNSRIVVVNAPDSVSMTVASDVFNGTEQIVPVRLSLSSRKDDTSAQIGAAFEGAASRDIALQAPVLSFLALLDAPISGSMRSSITPEGVFGPLAATLEIGAGVLRPDPAARPLRFNAARSYFSYDPQRRMLQFSELSMRSEAASIAAEGQAFLRDLDQGWPRTLIGQFSITEARAEAGAMLTDPLVLRDGRADVRLTLDPFRLELGQLSVSDGASRVSARGEVDIGAEGWTLSIDGGVDRIETAALEAIWPVPFIPNTRKWVLNNVTGGQVTDMAFAVRANQGTRPQVAFRADFAQAAISALRGMPRIEAAAGRFSLDQDRFALVLAEGEATPEQGGAVDLAGSSLTIADTTKRPGRAEIALRSQGSITGHLSLLAQPPLNLLARSPLGPDLAEGQARVQTSIGFDLTGRRVAPKDIAFAATGDLADVVSTVLVPGRTLQAPALRLELDRTQVRIAGDVTLDALAADAVWTRPLGPGAEARIDARLQLDQATLEAVGAQPSRNMMSGAAEAIAQVSLPAGAPPRLTVTSDLVGLDLRLPQLGWSKPPLTPGALSLEVTLGPAPSVEALSFAAPGLSAEGRLVLGEAGGLERAEFARVVAGTWLDAPVILTPRGPGRPPALVLRGGRLDLRGGLPGGSGDGPRPPVQLALEQLVISDTIALAPFEGQLDGTTGGSFSARVNGGTAVRGEVVNQPGGLAVRLRSQDAGGVIRDAGLARGTRGGAMELVLLPREGRAGFDGTLNAQGLRIQDAPGLASLLDAISIVGILDEMEGSGILFSDVEAQFRLTPDRLIVDQGSAVGASLGISLDGTYDLTSKVMDMGGVISPIYILNGIGQIFTRRGEGLFGFTYTLDGTPQAPQVAVNPLSIFTPGMFREIFRRPPPQPGE